MYFALLIFSLIRFIHIIYAQNVSIYFIYVTYIFQGSECTIKESIKVQHDNVKCTFTDIIRVDDNKLTEGDSTTTDSVYKLEASDVVSRRYLII